MAEYSAGQFVKLIWAKIEREGAGNEQALFSCVLDKIKRRSYIAFQNNFFNTHTLSPSGASCL